MAPPFLHFSEAAKVRGGTVQGCQPQNEKNAPSQMKKLPQLGIFNYFTTKMPEHQKWGIFQVLFNNFINQEKWPMI